MMMSVIVIQMIMILMILIVVFTHNAVLHILLISVNDKHNTNTPIINTNNISNSIYTQCFDNGVCCAEDWHHIVYSTHRTSI